MKSSELCALLRPYKAVINPRALSPASRVIEIGPKLRANCDWACIESRYGAEHAPVFVDGASFIATIESLNNDDEFIDTLSENVLEWRCGRAAGKFALIPDIEMAAYSRRVKQPWATSENFKKVLQLGMLSAGSSALATVGLFGVSIALANERISVMASDNMTLSYSECAAAKLSGPPIVTLTPEGTDLLALLMQADTTIELDTQAVHIASALYKARINQIDPIRSKISETLQTFQSASVKVKLPRERIAAFVKRASALAEAKRHTAVWIGATKGKLTTSFSEGIATTEEDYLIDDLDIPDLAPVQVDASKFARALSGSEFLILDHIKKHVLVLHSDKPQFRYLISARPKA